MWDGEKAGFDRIGLRALALALALLRLIIQYIKCILNK